MQKLLHIGIFFSAHQEDTQNREENAQPSQAHGHSQVAQLHAGQGATLQESRIGESGGGYSGHAQGGRGQNRTSVGFIKVSAHAGDVTDVVTHVVGNGRRIARVVFRNTSLHFADQVRTHVGRFGENAAADTRKQRLCRSAHPEANHHHRNLGQRIYIAKEVDREDLVQNQEPDRNVQQSEADYHQAHDRPGAESDLQAAVQAFAGGIGRTG